MSDHGDDLIPMIVCREVLDMLCEEMARVEQGALITVTYDIGEPRNGLYEPTFTKHTRPLSELSPAGGRGVVATLTIAVKDLTAFKLMAASLHLLVAEMKRDKSPYAKTLEDIIKRFVEYDPKMDEVAETPQQEAK